MGDTVGDTHYPCSEKGAAVFYLEGCSKLKGLLVYYWNIEKHCPGERDVRLAIYGLDFKRDLVLCNAVAIRVGAGAII